MPDSRHQDDLTDKTFQKLLLPVESDPDQVPYQQVSVKALCKLKRPYGTLRYIVDSYDKQGHFVERKYRVGGVLIHLDVPRLRYAVLKNPSTGATWSMQLQPPDAQVTLYYKPARPKAATFDDGIRGLLEKYKKEGLIS